MRKCIRCDTEMIEDLNVMTSDGFGVDVREKGIFKSSLGKLKCAACPDCGYVEVYLDNTERLKKLEQKKSGRLDLNKKMGTNIRVMVRADKTAVIEMMRTFYSSPAVLTDGSEEIFESDFENCVNENPYLEGYLFEGGDNVQGYAMVAKSFSTEFGKPCIWIEDLYIREDYRGTGIGKSFFAFITEKYKGCIFRLEAERENERAIGLYQKCGFEVLPYTEMKKS